MRRRIIASLTSLCVLLLSLGGPAFAFAAQAGGQGAGQPGGAQPPMPPYKLRPGDQIRITVQPQGGIYNVELPIGPDGRIYYPVVGEVIAAGKTIPELTQILTTGLMKELRNFTVTVQLLRTADTGPGNPPPPGGQQGAA